MSNVGYATLTIIPSAKGFREALGRETGAPMREQGKRSGGLLGGGIVAGAAKAIGPLAAVFGAVKIGGFFKGTIEEASSLGESVNALNVTYGKHSEGIQALGKSAATSLGLSNLEFNNLAVRFSGFAGTIAGEGGNVVGTLDDLTTRASDFASVMNLDVAEAAELFQSGLAGETEPLRRFGLDMSAASVEAYAYANGIAETGEKLTEQQKVQARYGSLMEQTAKTHGDFANTSDALANQQRILASRWADLKARIGAGLLPAMTGLVSFVNANLIPAFEAVGGFVSSTIVPAFETARTAISGLFSGGGGEGGAGFLATLQTIGAQVVAFVQSLDFSGLVAGLSSLFGSIASIVQGSIIPALQRFWAIAQPAISGFGEMLRTVLANVGPILTGIGNVITTVWGFIGPFIIDGLAAIFANIVGVVTGIFDVISGVVSLVSALFRGDWAAAWDSVKQIVSGAVQAVWNLIQLWIVGRVVGIARGALGLLGRLFGGAWRGISSGVSSFVSTVVGAIARFFGNIVGRVTSSMGNIRGFFSAGWSAVQSLTRSAFTRVVSVVRTGISEAVGFVRGLPGKALSALGNVGTRLTSAGKDLIRGFIDGIKTAAMGLASAVLDPVRDAVAGVKSFLGINSPSRLFMEIGGYTGEGMAIGLEGSARRIAQASEALIPAAPSVRSPSVESGGVAGALRSAANPLVGALTLQSTGDTGDDLEEALFHLRRISRGGLYA